MKKIKRKKKELERIIKLCCVIYKVQGYNDILTLLLYTPDVSVIAMTLPGKNGNKKWDNVRRTAIDTLSLLHILS